MRLSYRLRRLSYAIGFLIPLSAIIWAFWQPITSSLALWALKSYCSICLDANFSSQNIHWRDGELIIHTPSLSKPAGSEPWIVSQAAEMRIAAHWSPFGEGLTFYTTFVSPLVEVTSPTEEQLLSLSNTPRVNYPVSIDAHMCFDQGLLLFKDLSTGHQSRFAFDGSSSKLQDNYILTSQNQGTLRCSNEGDEWSLSFDGVDLADVHHALNTIRVNSLPLHVHQGILHGNLNIDWDLEDVPNIHGLLAVQECIFSTLAGDMHAYMPEAELTVRDSSFAGEFSFGKGAYLEFIQEGKPPISLSQLEGSISLPAYDRCQIKTHGLFTHHGQTFSLSVQGQVRVPPQDKAICECEVLLVNDNERPIRACLSSYRENFGHSQCSLDMQNIGAAEWDLLMNLLGTQDIGLDPYTLRNGLIDAKIILDLKSFKVQKINIEEFVAKQIAFDLDQSDTHVKIDHAHGSLSLDLSAPNVLETLQACFGINGGVVEFPAINARKWQLSNLMTELTVSNGTLKKSFIESDFMGLRGHIEVDWSSKKAMSFRFDGKVHDLAVLASSNMSDEVLDKFKGDGLSIVADVQRAPSGLNVEGAINIGPAGEGPAESIQMGFILEKNSVNDRLLSPSTVLFSQRLGSDVVEALVRQMEKPKEGPAVEWLKEELRIAGFRLKDGWFNAPQLPTEKYIEPFFFRDNPMHVNGTADFQGRFDANGIAVEYQGDNLTLENDDLAFHIGHVGLSQPARHYFDIIHHTDQGIIPVANGSYFEKNSGLLFTDLEGSFILKDKSFCVPTMTTKCNNVTFAGMIAVDYSSPEKRTFDVDIATTSIEGSCRDVRDFVSHFSPKDPFASCSLDGCMSTTAANGSSSGGVFHFAFRPTGCMVKAAICGSIQEGKLSTSIEGIAFEHVSFDFDYIHEARQLTVKKIAGSLTSSGSVESPLSLSNGYVYIQDIEKGIGAFDLAFLDNSKELLRIAGSTNISKQSDKDGLLLLTFDREMSHCSGAHPEKMEVAFDEKGEIESADFNCRYDLATCFAGIHKIGEKILEASLSHMATQWRNLNSPSGIVDLNIQYDNSSKQLNLLLNGKDIHFGDLTFNNVIFAAAKKRNAWSIEQLQLDKISAAADVHPQPHGCQVNFLGLRYGDVLLMGLDGFYDYQKTVFDGNIHLLELDFSKLSQWKSFRELFNDYHPQGEMKGSGTLQICLEEQWPPTVEVNLKGGIKNCVLRDLHFEDVDNVSCKFILGDKLTIGDCRSGFKCTSSGDSKGLFHVDTALYDFKKEELTLNGLHFHTHATSLDWIAESLESQFPEAFSPKIANIIKHIKTDDNFQGNMDIRINDDESKVVLRLPQGKYKLGTKEHEVTHFLLEWDKKNLQVVSQYRFQNTLYWLTVKSTSPDVDAGEIIVSSYPPNHLHESLSGECLCIAWYMHPQYGMVVEKATGKLPGISIDLSRDRQYPMNPHSWHLDGNIVLDPLVGAHILPPDIVEALSSWDISRNYNLSGKWIFMLEDPNDGELYFTGQLSAQESIFKGYQVGSIHADLNCSPTQIDIENLIFQDSAGTLTVERSSMVKLPSGEWWVYIPHLSGENFRPSLLRDVAHPADSQKPLVITHVEINNIACCADNLSTMTGSGSMTFSNSSKRSLHNPLLAIPAEIISRIGLNLNVLNPVKGSIFFTISDYKVKLTKFKEVYSEGKLSKFYLPHTNYSSYVDFDGNVHVQVRMKQYNLLFKLAELFTVTIHGSLQKPIYTLQKQ